MATALSASVRAGSAGTADVAVAVVVAVDVGMAAVRSLALCAVGTSLCFVCNIPEPPPAAALSHGLGGEPPDMASPASRRVSCYVDVVGDRKDELPSSASL